VDKSFSLVLHGDVAQLRLRGSEVGYSRDVTKTSARMVALGAAITRLREASGESKSATAAAIGMTRFFLRGVEAGERNISVARLFDIADHFGVPPAALFSDIT